MSLVETVTLLMAIGARITRLEKRHDAGRRFWQKVGKLLRKIWPR